ncbi:MAG: Gfo/Idh/MocA family oxidoreductase [Ruminococcaceae bacterium]|nr:Gfo/Idh/MocA family oxidoreductase [Oscillospiraceae bacterium]
MMKPIRIAHIGLNRYSHSHEVFYTMTQHPELYEIVGYAVVEDERETCADKLKHFEGYPELTLKEILNDPTIEAVTVETDEIHLTKYAQMAVDAGKHIHMEKPGSQNLADFERLIESAKAGGKTFHIGYMYRYNPLISRAIERAKNGEFGTIYSVEAHMSRLDKKTTREWFESFKGGMMFYLGCHLVDLVLQIQGMPTNVIPLNTATGLDGVDTEDLGFAVLQYPHGVSVIRMGGTEVGGFARRQLVICGSKRTLEIKPLERGTEEKYMLTAAQTERYLDGDGHTQKAVTDVGPFQRYEAMMYAFAQMVRGEKTNPYTLDYELQLYKLILACCGM